MEDILGKIIKIPIVRKNIRKMLVRLGIRFIGVPEDNSRLQLVRLPLNFKLVEMDKISMIIDLEERARISIDYNTHKLYVKTRFEICHIKKPKGSKSPHYIVKDWEKNKIIFSSTALTKKESIKEVVIWLDNNFPMWKNPMAYWRE